MKVVLSIIASLMLAAAAHATPAVGDQVAFQGTWGGQAVQQGLAITEFNAGARQYKKYTVTKIGEAAPQSQEEWVNADDMASDAALSAIVANCPQYNGVAQQIQVPAGNFQTCRLALEQGGYVWIGQVPFAVVRIETPVQGQTLTAVLTGFTRGQ